MAASGDKTLARDLVAFWIFGLANNFAYVVMLSGAMDIISKQEHSGNSEKGKPLNTSLLMCEDMVTERHCNRLPTGAVLLADILPSLIVKLTFPFFMHRIPFGMRHASVCFLQAISYIIVAFSTSLFMSLTGVVFASFAAGLGEISYLALTAHYSKNTVSTWSSGTGGAGIAGALAYATLTEPHLAGLKPSTALLSMLIVPALFLVTYWMVLSPKSTIHRIQLLNVKTWIVPSTRMSICSAASNGFPKNCAIADSTTSQQIAIGRHLSDEQNIIADKMHLGLSTKLRLILPLLRYMIPLCLVYFAEYLLNQGIMINVVIFFYDAIYRYIPHIVIVFTLILFEGFLGGAAYVNTFNRIHKEAKPSVREFSLSIAALSDSFGILASGLTSIPLHEFICSTPL